MHFVALLAASFVTALNALKQCHFWHRHTVENCWNKTCVFHKVV